jgi:hypothetical protein
VVQENRLVGDFEVEAVVLGDVLDHEGVEVFLDREVLRTLVYEIVVVELQVAACG